MAAENGNGNRSVKIADACSALVRRQRTGRVSNDSEDALQDACVRALEMKTPEAVRDPVRYVIRITRNLCIDHQRKKQRYATVLNNVANSALISDDLPDPEQLLVGKETLTTIMMAIDRLPPRCYEAFVLHRFEHMSYPAIARQMGINIKTVEKHISEAMSRLSKALTSTGLAP